MNRSFARLAAAMLTLVAVEAFATQVIQRTPQELAQDSELVVDGGYLLG